MHTKEPWKVAEEGEFIAVVDDSGFTVLPDMRISQYADDFRRIVACVNACSGMDDPEAHITLLEDNANDAGMYKHQRDELLAALNEIMKFADEPEYGIAARAIAKCES